MRTGYIYTLSDPITGEVRYIGQTKQNINKRFARHISESKSEDYKNKISTSTKDRWRRTFYCYDKKTKELLSEWTSIIECSSNLKIQSTGVSAVLNGRAKSCSGYIFEFKNN